jgi:GTP:adenosylcobinamide-phosphate guanylyltransferase
MPITAELDCYRPELLLNLNRPDDLRRARRLRTANAEAAR